MINWVQERPNLLHALRFLIACLLIWLLGYITILQGMQAELRSKLYQENLLKSRLEKKLFQAAYLADYRQQLEEMNTQLAFLKSNLPGVVSFEGVHEDAISFAQDSQVRLTNFKYIGDTQSEFFVSRIFEMKLLGDYKGTQEFILRWEKTPLIVQPTALKMTQTSSGLQSTLSVFAYQFRETPEQ